MKIGNIIRKSFHIFMDTPILIIPFLFLGVVRNITRFVSEGALRNSLAFTEFDFIKYLTSSVQLTEGLANLAVDFTILVLLFAVMLLVIGSFVEAYAIGIARRAIRNRNTQLKHGLSTFNRGLQILIKKLMIVLIGLGGAFVIFLPTIILFGQFGILIAIFMLLVFLIILLAASFFSSQSIVIDNASAWKGIVKSYYFIKKHLEGVALLIVFIIFIYGGLTVMQASGELIGRYFLSGASMFFFTKGLNLFLFYVLFAPYLIVLKTYFYMKRK